MSLSLGIRTVLVASMVVGGSLVAREGLADSCSRCNGTKLVWSSVRKAPTHPTSMIMPGDRNWLRGGATHYRHMTRPSGGGKRSVQVTCPRCQGSGFEPGYKPPTEAQRAQSSKDFRERAIYVGGQRVLPRGLYHPPSRGVHGIGIYAAGTGKNPKLGLVGGSVRKPVFVLRPGWQHIDSFTKKVVLARARKGGKWGFLDARGRIRISPQYDEAQRFLRDGGGYVPVARRGRWGLIDDKGRVQLPLEYEDVTPLAKAKSWFVKKRGRWGIARPGRGSIGGSVLIKPAWDRIYVREDRGVVVSRGKRFGLYDLSGGLLVPAQFTNFRSFGSDHLVWDSKKAGLVRDAKVLIKARYASIGSKAGLLFAVAHGGRKTWFTNEGEKLRDGVERLEPLGKDLFFSLPQGKTTGRIEDRAGHAKLRRLTSADILPSGGIRAVGPRGQALLAPDGARPFKGCWAEILPMQGLLRLTKGKGAKVRFGVAGADGRLIAAAKYDEVRIRSAASPVEVRTGKTWGVIARDGSQLAEVQYETLVSDNVGIAAKKDGKWGLLDLKGQPVVPFKYDRLGAPRVGRRLVAIGDHFGYLHEAGRIIVPVKYAEVSPYDAAALVAWVRDGEHWGLVNFDGTLLLPVESPRGKLKILRGVRVVDIPGARTRMPLVTLRKNALKAHAEGRGPPSLAEAQKTAKAEAAAKRNERARASGRRSRARQARIEREKHVKGAPMLTECPDKDRFGYKEGGRWTIECKYVKAEHFQGRMLGSLFAFVKTKEGWGLIKEDGKLLLEPKYDEIRAVGEDLVKVRDKDEWGIYRTDLQDWVLDVDYQEITGFGREILAVRDDDEWGIFSLRKRKMAVDPDCEQLKRYQGKILCQDGGDWYWLDWVHDDRESLSDAEIAGLPARLTRAR